MKTIRTLFHCSIGALGFWSSLAGAAATFQPLGDLAGRGFYSVAYAVSQSGAVVGQSESAGTSDRGEAFIWSPSGMTGLGDFPVDPLQSAAYTIAAVAEVPAGFGYSGTNQLGASWDDGPGGEVYYFGEGTFDGVMTTAYGAADDDTVYVGSGVDGQGRDQAVLWSDGVLGLDDLPGGAYASSARAVSADGTVVVGYGNSGPGQEAFRWTAAGGMQGLGDLAGGGFGSIAHAISPSGLYIAGMGTGVNGFEAFVHTASSGMVGMGDLPGGAFGSAALGVSASFQVVGYGQGAAGKEAFIWHPAVGMHRLQDVLVDQGATGLTGWTLVEATAIREATGHVWVVGHGLNPQGNTEAFRADLPDTDGDGIIDAFDNCIAVANATQCDSDIDGYGNACDGDLNNNGFTNAVDTTLYRQQLGQPSTPPVYNQADQNCSGGINAVDTTLFRRRLGSPPGPSGLVP